MLEYNAWIFYTVTFATALNFLFLIGVIGSLNKLIKEFQKEKIINEELKQKNFNKKISYSNWDGIQSSKNWDGVPRDIN